MTVDVCWSTCSFTGGGMNIATLKCLECVFQAILQITIRAAGIVAFILLVIGGFKYLTAGGDPKATQSAQGTITYAIAGIFLMILAWFILRFIALFTNVPVNVFVIPSP